MVERDGLRALILDVQISYETGVSTLSQRDLAKREKYRAESTSILSHLLDRGYMVHELNFYGLIFGSRGAIHNVTLNLLKEFGVTDNWICGLISKIMYESKLIYDIWGPHVTNPNRTES